MYVCMHIYMNVNFCIYFSQTYMSLCAYVCINVWVYIWIHYVCMHVYQVSTPMSLCTHLMCQGTNMTTTLQMSHTAITLNRHIDPTFLHKSTRIRFYIYLTCYCYVWANNKYALLIPHIGHICKLLHIEIRQLCQNICLICTYSNQECDHTHWYAYISHYWHMPLNKYAWHTAKISPFNTTTLS